jgi:hypothetical protein
LDLLAFLNLWPEDTRLSPELHIPVYFHEKSIYAFSNDEIEARMLRPAMLFGFDK